jgi:RimJ/RimL family protein N-acetyltransferase
MSQLIETPHLALRELSMDDLGFMADMLAHPEVMQFWPSRLSRDKAMAWIRRQRERYTRDGYGYWLAVERATGQPVGQAGLLALEIDGVAETGLGYIFHRPFWGHGYATEAAAACLGYAFATLDKPRVVAPIRPENAASVAVARRLGMQVEKRTIYAGFEHLIFYCDIPCSAISNLQSLISTHQYARS